MNDDLFNLIKTLDKNEKGYFKKFAARYGEKSTGSDYMKLFEAIDKMEVYDENKVKQQFLNSGKKVNLSLQKSYLQEQLIRSMRAYSSGKSSAYSITESLLDIQNLIDKNLTNQAFDLIYDSYKKATAVDNTGLQLQLKIVEDKLKVRYNRQFSNEQILNVKEEIKELSQLLQTEQLLGTLFIEMKRSDERRGVEEKVSQQERVLLEQLMANPVFDTLPLLPNRLKITAYNVLHLGNMLLKNLDIAIDYLKKMQAIYKQIEMDANTTISYLGSINNLLVISLGANYFNETEACLKELENSRYKDKRLEEFRKVLYSKNLLIYLYEKSNFNLLSSEIEEAEKHYLQVPIKLSGNNNLFSCFYLGVLFLGQQQYDKAMIWIQKTIDHENTTYINVQAYCRIIAAIIHYEQGNLSLVESTLQNLHYFMKKNDFTNSYIKKVAAVIAKLPTLNTKQQKLDYYNKIVLTFRELNVTELKGETSYFDTLDLTVWAQSKVNNVSYAKQLATK